MTAAHQIVHQVKLRLGQAKPPSTPEVEIQVADGLKTTIEGGVSVERINKIGVLFSQPEDGLDEL